MSKKSISIIVVFLLFLGVNRLVIAAPMTLEAVSAGFNDPGHRGGTAQLWVDGVDYSLNTRGFNMVVLDQYSGMVLEQVSFDTHATFNESNRMAAFIDSIDPGRIVLSAVRDEASRRLNNYAINALNTLGINGNPLSYRSSWAFIGIKGGSAGSAIEDFASARQGPISVSTTINAVPLPGSIFLLGTGLMLIGSMRFKKYRKESISLGLAV